ncbi:hypothetical protein niasHT_027576 [Heterodera trifolii]|uniref:Protein Dr1 n=1 Tax=Heterodera trifolii TaxID=157864 RepID=A0ABD2K558_9BILA
MGVAGAGFVLILVVGTTASDGQGKGLVVGGGAGDTLRKEMTEEENEVGLPQKGVNMIIKDALPDMRIANETRELLNQCCVEFVRHVSREAQHISSKDQRKTIYHDHVQKALKNLGFPREYVDAANSVLGECKIAAEKRLKRKNSRLDKCGIPEEQLWQMQQQLIEKVGGGEGTAAIWKWNGHKVRVNGVELEEWRMINDNKLLDWIGIGARTKRDDF